MGGEEGQHHDGVPANKITGGDGEMQPPPKKPEAADVEDNEEQGTGRKEGEEAESRALTQAADAEALRTLENPNSPEQIHDQLMGRFTRYTDELRATIEANRNTEGERRQNRMAVVVSLWEEDATMIASKMFEHSITNLVQQAKDSGIQLDVIMVANTGGGSTYELGAAMQERLTGFFHDKFGVESLNKVTAQKPERPDSTTPWDIDLNMKKMAEAADGNKYILVNQPKHFVDIDGKQKDVNAGKLRALRDVSHSLAREMKENGYAPDAMFQMDAETILEYAPGVLPGNAEPIPPLKVMYNNLTRKDLIAVGTKDRFEPMDPETGKPLGIPRSSAQEGYMLENHDKFITLPGGALMARPEYYVAGMMAISETVPGCGVEDYLFTKMVHDLDPDKNDDIIYAASLNILTHLNRCPTGKDAVLQLKRWRDAGRGVDQIFPDHQYNTEPLTKYLRMVMKSRLSHALQGDVAYVRQLISDVFELGDVRQFLNSKDVSDIVGGDAGWKHKPEPAIQIASVRAAIDNIDGNP